MLRNIVKRTFEAKRYQDPKIRAELNKSSITSEYMTSHKWTLLEWDNDGTPIAELTFKTRKEASNFGNN